MLKVRRLRIFPMLKRKLSKASSLPTAEPEPPKNPRTEPPESEAPVNNSPYFANSTMSFPQTFLNLQLELNSHLRTLEFQPPTAYIYNPLEYAFRPNEIYIKKYCTGPKKVLFTGMNPGPFGMCQTGVPFGEIKMVRDWLDIEEEVGKPAIECPERPIMGFSCPRSEVSGHRLWNLFKNISVNPEVFFQNCFVLNYCPLALMNAKGNNVTPSDIKDRELEKICDQYYLKIIELLNPEIIVGIGRYVEKRTLTVIKNTDFANIKVLYLVHPSDRVMNNGNWPEKAEAFLESNDLMKYLVP